MRRTTAILALVSLIAVTGWVLAAVEPSMAPPPGVNANQWHQINDRLGLVVEDAAGPLQLEGKLMVKQGEVWMPVYLAPATYARPAR